MSTFNLDFQANDKQILAFQYLEDSITNEIWYGGGAGGGKSYMWVAWQWIRRIQYPWTRGFFWRKELKRLKQTTLATYFKFCQNHNIPEKLRWNYNAQDGVIRFYNGSEILLLDLAPMPSDPMYERFGSLELTDGFIDESWEISEKCIEIILTRIGRQENEKYWLIPKLLESFNPNKGHIYSRYYKPYKEEKLPEYRAFIPALATDNPYLPESYVEALKRSSEVTKQRLLYGNFEYDDRPHKLFDFDKIQDIFTNPLHNGEKYIVGDVAWEWKDRGVISVWNWFEIIDAKIFEKCSAIEYQDAVKFFAEKYKIPMSRTLLDQDGIGWGVVGNLRCKWFQNNSRPIDNRPKSEQQHQGWKPSFQNLKTQCYFLLADNFEKINISVLERYREEIIAELDVYEEIDVDKDGPRKITPKEQIKEIIGRSPDFADTFAMRMYFEIAPQKRVARIF